MTERPEVSAQSMGEAAYRAYIANRGGVTFSGAPAPAWAELPRDIQTAWEIGAEASRDWLLQARGWNVLLEVMDEAAAMRRRAEPYFEKPAEILARNMGKYGDALPFATPAAARGAWLEVAAGALTAMQDLDRSER